MAKKKNIYSYIKYPHAGGGRFSFVLSVIAFIMTQFIVTNAVRSSGEVSMMLAAAGFSAILIDISAVIFAISGFTEKEKNYTFVVIGAVISFIVLAEWAIILMR